MAIALKVKADVTQRRIDKRKLDQRLRYILGGDWVNREVDLDAPAWNCGIERFGNFTQEPVIFAGLDIQLLERCDDFLVGITLGHDLFQQEVEHISKRRRAAHLRLLGWRGQCWHIEHLPDLCSSYVLRAIEQGSIELPFGDAEDVALILLNSDLVIGLEVAANG